MKSRRFYFGEWIEKDEAMSVDDINMLCDLADKRRREMQSYPLDKILKICAELRTLWSNPEYKLRKELYEVLPEVTGFSKEMITLALEEMNSVFSPELLQRKVSVELQGLSRTEWKYDFNTSTAMIFQPLGVVLHVLSGNVFLVAIGSLLEGWLTGNVNILKMSSNEKEFLPRFLASLKEVDKEGVLYRSTAVIDYRSSEVQIISELKKRVDGILIWGGEDAVKAYRNDLPARTRMILFGPKLSVGLVSKSGMEKGVDKVAEDLSLEISIWDQNACTAPQLCFVQGEQNARALTEAMHLAMQKRSELLPAGTLELNAAVEIQKLRSVAEIADFRGDGMLRESKGNVDWTIIYSKDKKIEPSPLHRTIKIVSFKTFEEVFKEFEELRGYIQTIGLSSSHSEYFTLSQACISHGALRVLKLGQMFSGEIDEPHDGLYDLPQLGNTVFARLPDSNIFPIDLMIAREREKIINERLRSLLFRAEKSPYYSKILKGKEIESISDLKKLPMLSRELLEKNIPPQAIVGEGLSGKIPSGGYVSRSGGSSGEPKFSVYDREDWNHMITEAVRVLMAAGMRRGDRVANCMLSGDLYGSFVSFDHINHQIGAQTFAFAGTLDPNVFLKVWREFKLNVIQAMPTVLVPLLRKLKELEPGFHIEKIIYAGLPLSTSDREWIEKNVGVKSIASIIGANDGGQIAFQCGYLKGSEHHLIDDFNYIEIVDEEGKEVPFGDSGKILITSLLKNSYPLIRYEIGDSARFLDKVCPCGRTNRIIDYLGRSDDTLCVSMMNFRYRDAVSALEGFSYSVLQVAAVSEQGAEGLIIRLETTDTTEGMKVKIRETLFSKISVLRARQEDGSLKIFRIELLEAGMLPRNSRTGKVKQICDERL